MSSSSSQNGNPLALPPTLSPDALDTLTELTTILTRLRASLQSQNSSSSSVSGQASQAGLGGAGGVTGSTPLPSSGATPNVTGSGSLGGAAASPSASAAGGGGGGPASLREVSAQTDALKHKLQRARVQVKALPDMGRGLEEQEEEMRELEERIRVQRSVLEGLKEKGARFGSEGEKMETD